MSEHYCECKYKEQCHMPRQYVQKMIRDQHSEKTVEDCEFYGYITELARKNNQKGK